MFRRPARLVALICVLASLLMAQHAAASLAPAVADCNAHAQLTHAYSVSELQTALKTMPADIKEYTNCYDVIQGALLARLGHRHVGGTGQGGGSFLPKPVLIILVLLGLSAVSVAVIALRRRWSAEGPP